jgi:hypothetical protein
MSRGKGVYGVIMFVFFTLLMVASASAENVLINACYQKNHGQLRIVDSPDQCLASEIPISWDAQSSPPNAQITLYVATSGQDTPGYGKTPGTPFRTISYALRQVPTLRNSEYRAIINVAEGSYNEDINISIASVSIIGKDAGSTEIVGTGTANIPAVQVYGRGVVLSRLKIRNGGGDGVYAETAKLTMSNCDIQDNDGYAGVVATHNTTLFMTNTKVQSNSGVGVAIYRSSSLDADGLTINDNNSNGLEVFYSATARLRSSSEIKGNGEDGILAGGGSSVRLENTKVLDNWLCGIDTTSSSSTVLRGGNVIKNNNLSKTSWRGGVGIYQGSEFSVTNPGLPRDQIIGNYGNGIALGNSSMSLIAVADITGNMGNGIRLDLSSSGQFENQVTIGNNDGWGIFCNRSIVSNTAVVNSNGAGNVSCP